MRVYVIRHGESESNASKKWTGWMDVELTEKGKKLDLKLRQIFKTCLSFDFVFNAIFSHANIVFNGSLLKSPEKITLMLSFIKSSSYFVK